MTLFWIIAGLLLAGALLFVVPPLVGTRRRRALAASRREANISIYRDQMQELEIDLAAGTLSADQYQQARRELESRVLEDTAVGGLPDHAVSQGSKWLPLVVGVGVPVLAVSLYLALGNLRGLDPQQALPAQAAGGQSTHEVTAEQIAGLVDSLAAKLKQEPDNPQGWVMLARSYSVLQRFPEAVQAYEKAVALVPDDGQLLADYADALAMVQNGDLSGRPAQMIEKSLDADPNNIKGLALAGTVAFEQGNYAAAVSHWQKAASLLPPESDFARSIQNSIAEAQQKGGLAPSVAAAAREAATPARADAAGASIAGTVTLSPELSAKVAPGDTVFVFARAAAGPRMPLVIVRKQVKDLPIHFSLDDSMAMAPNMKLSSFPRVVVGARISKSGNAIAQSGDLESAPQAAALGTTGLKVVIGAEVK